jgi:hypothetical protein
MADTRRSLLAIDLIAASLSHREYLHLRNTVRVLRFSGAPLNSDQEEKVKEFEAVVAAYEVIQVEAQEFKAAVAARKQEANG